MHLFSVSTLHRVCIAHVLIWAIWARSPCFAHIWQCRTDLRCSCFQCVVLAMCCQLFVCVHVHDLMFELIRMARFAFPKRFVLFSCVFIQELLINSYIKPNMFVPRTGDPSYLLSLQHVYIVKWALPFECVTAGLYCQVSMFVLIEAFKFVFMSISNMRSLT